MPLAHNNNRRRQLLILSEHRPRLNHSRTSKLRFPSSNNLRFEQRVFLEVEDLISLDGVDEEEAQEFIRGELCRDREVEEVV